VVLLRLRKFEHGFNNDEGIDAMYEIQGIKSNHMLTRQQQRGISNDLIMLMSGYGRAAYNRGSWVTDLTNEGLSQLLKDFPELDSQSIEKLSRCYLIEVSGVEVTVAFKKKGWGKRFSPGRQNRSSRTSVKH
jgi:hypothetical protein